MSTDLHVRALEMQTFVAHARGLLLAQEAKPSQKERRLSSRNWHSGTPQVLSHLLMLSITIGVCSVITYAPSRAVSVVNTFNEFFLGYLRF